MSTAAQTVNQKPTNNFSKVDQKTIDAYQNDGIPAWWIVDMTLRNSNPYKDRRVIVNISELVQQTNLPKSTIYQAVSKLKVLGRLIKDSQEWILDHFYDEKHHSQQANNYDKSEYSQQANSYDKSENPHQVRNSKVIDFQTKMKQRTTNYEISENNSKISENNSKILDKNYEILENHRPKLASDAGFGTPQTNKTPQTNTDKYIYPQLQDFWWDEEETKQEDIYVNNPETKQAVEQLRKELENSTVEAEIVEQQDKNISTSTKTNTDSFVKNSNGNEEKSSASDITIKQYSYKEQRKWRKSTKNGVTSDYRAEYLEKRPWLDENGQVKHIVLEMLAKDFIRSEAPSMKHVTKMKHALMVARLDVNKKIKNEEVDGEPSVSMAALWERCYGEIEDEVENTVVRDLAGIATQKEKEERALKATELAHPPLPEYSISAPPKTLQQTTNSVAAIKSTAQVLQKNTKKLSAAHEMISRGADNKQFNFTNTISIPNKAPKIPEGADNVEAYKSFDRAEYERKRKQEEEQMASPEQWAEFTAKFKTFNKKSSLRPVIEDTEDPFEKIRKQLKTLNSFLKSGDTVLIGEALKVAEKENFVVIRNKLGHPIKIEDLEF